MKFLRALMEASKALDPAVITAGDVSTYVRQVKISLKGERITKSAIADAIHELIEDDPKFGSNSSIASELIAKVQERMMKQIMEGTLEDRCVVLVGKVEKAYDKMSAGKKASYRALLKTFNAGKSVNDKEKMTAALDDIDELLHDQAERMGESVEHLEELSKDTLSDYRKYAIDSHEHHEREYCKHMDRRDQARRLQNDHEAIRDFESVQNPVDHEAVKMHDKMAKAQKELGDYHHGEFMKHRRKLQTRGDGIVHAETRIAKESVEHLEELSKHALMRYSEKSAAHQQGDLSDHERHSNMYYTARFRGEDHRERHSQAMAKSPPDKEAAEEHDGLADAYGKIAAYHWNKKEAAGDRLGKRVRGANRADVKLRKFSESTVNEGWDDEDDEDPDVKIADKEAKKRGIKLLSPKAQAALDAKMSKVDRSEEDAASKKAAKSNEEEEEELDDEDYEDPDVKIADKEAKKRGIKLLSPKAQKALDLKLAKADKKDEDASSKKVDESVASIKSDFFDAVDQLTK